MPRASLKDFLNETGVKFMDTMANLNRRETIGRSRDSEIVTAARQLYTDVSLTIEADALDATCAKLVKMVTAVKEDLAKQEEQFNHSPPLAFLEHRDPQLRTEVIGKLKSLKSIARLLAMKSWYELRTIHHETLNENLFPNASFAEQQALFLTNLNEQLDEMIAVLEPALISLSDEVATVRERVQQMQTDDAEQVQQLEKLSAFQQAKLISMDEEMATLNLHEQELRGRIEAALAKQKSNMQALNNLRQQLDAVPDSSPMLLDELRSTIDLLSGVSGWKLLRCSNSELQLLFVRGNLGITLYIDHGIVSSVNFNLLTSKSRLLKHGCRMIKGLSGMDIRSTILQLGTRLDRLCLIDKQLSVVGVQCQVEIPEELEASEFVPVNLRFLHSGVKLDVVLGVDADRTVFISCKGPVAEQNVKDAVNLALNQHKHHAIRKAVSSLLELVDNLK